MKVAKVIRAFTDKHTHKTIVKGAIIELEDARCEELILKGKVMVVEKDKSSGPVASEKEIIQNPGKKKK